MEGNNPERYSWVSLVGISRDNVTVITWRDGRGCSAFTLMKCTCSLCTQNLVCETTCCLVARASSGHTSQQKTFQHSVMCTCYQQHFTLVAV